MSCDGNGKEVRFVTLINEAFQRASGNTSSPTEIKRRDYRWVWLLATVMITAAITYSLTRLLASAPTAMVAGEQVETTAGEAEQKTSRPNSAGSNITEPHIAGPTAAEPNIARSSVTPELSPVEERANPRPRYESLYSEAERARLAEREALADQIAPMPSSEKSGEGVQEAQIESADTRAVDALLEEAERQLESAATIDSTLPRLDELSPQIRDRIATLLYSAHDYASDGVSRVMLNGAWYSAGDTISGSLSLIEVQSDAIVLETLEGVQFIQPALSSWVNL
jgi:general secretion pathway protein B